VKTNHTIRVLEPGEVLDLIEQPYPFLRVRSATDALPSGLALAMVPALVDWNRSQLQGKDDDFYLVHNLNFGGNPAGGYNMLVTAKVPRHGVVRAEWVSTLLRIFKKDTPGGHGQLRLIFDPDRRPVVLNRDGTPFTNRPHLDDLVFSFEAWRPPAAHFDPLAGLDPKAYALTMRCYAAPQRFLEDSLRNLSWHCYPLALPPVEEAYDELLYTCLTMGDSLARHTFRKLLEDPGRFFDRDPQDYPDPLPEQIEKLREMLLDTSVPEDPIAQIMGGDISYHLLLRSCITMALTAIDACSSRIHQRHPQLGEYRPLRVTPKEIPSWAISLAHSNRRNMLMRLPGTIYWLIRNQDVLPDRAHQILLEGGLLQLDEQGQPVKKVYHISEETPYGRLLDNLMQ